MFKTTCGDTGVEFRFYKPAEFQKLTREQKDELRDHRKANGNYKGTWTGRERTGGANKSFGRAQVAAMIKEIEVEKEKETTERESLKATLVDELKSIISSQMVIAPEKRLQRAGAKVASATLDDDKGVAERCASALLQKFADMGAKAPGKSG